MYQWRNYPWTNFNELNLDWIMRLLKEIQVDAIPALDEKIDNTYNFITDNLSEIVGQLATVIWNVKWSGALGDGVTDDTAAIEDALTKSRLLYFPEGTYCFKNVTVNYPICIFGDGEETVFQPIRKQATSNQWFNMLTLNDSAYISNIQLRPLDSLATESGTKYYIESIIRSRNAESFYMDRVTFDNLFQAYHISVANPVLIDFEDREGIAMTVYNCSNTVIKNCTIHDFGGEELIMISRDRDKYGTGNVTITECNFTNRTSGLSGSAINTIGGSLCFCNNKAYNFNNIYTGGSNGGSLFNLMCANTVCCNNQFIDCHCGNYLDFGEGWFNKTENLLFSDNLLTGESTAPIKLMAKNAVISGNYIESANHLRFCGTNSPWDYTVAGVTYQIVPYCVDTNTVYTDYNNIVVDNNTFVITKAPYAYSAIQINTVISSVAANSTARNVKYNRIEITNNKFLRNSDAENLGTMYFNMPIGVLNVSNNMVKGAGVSFPSYTAPAAQTDEGTVYRAFISGAFAIDELLVTKNIIDATDYASDPLDGICIVTGASSLITQSNYYETYNMALGKVRDHSGAVSSLGSYHQNYNDGVIIGT